MYWSIHIYFWLLKSWQNLLVSIVSNPQLITLRLPFTHHTLVNWQRYTCFVENRSINSFQSKSLFDIVNRLLWGEKQYRCIEARWAEPVSLACHFVLRKLYTEPSIGKRQSSGLIKMFQDHHMTRISVPFDPWVMSEVQSAVGCRLWLVSWFTHTL